MHRHAHAHDEYLCMAREKVNCVVWIQSPAVFRTEWIDAISTVSKELRKTDVEAPNAKSAPKTEGATVPKQGIKVS